MTDQTLISLVFIYAALLINLIEPRIIKIKSLKTTRIKAPKIPKNKIELYKSHVSEQSKKWRKIRKLRLARDNFKCQNGHWWPATSNLHVHHCNYNNLGNEKLSDLITLCSKCHKKIHRN